MADIWEVWEYSRAPEFAPRNGVVGIHVATGDVDSRRLHAELCASEDKRRRLYSMRNGHADPFPRTFAVKYRKSE